MRVGAIGRWWVLPGLLAGLWAALPAAAKPPPDYHDPPPDHLVGPGSFKRLPSIDDHRWVVVSVRDMPYWKAGKADPVLTNACQLGQFTTPGTNRMVVRFTAEDGRGLLQIVPPTHRHLLADRRRLARADETYYFFDSGLATCQVWFAGQGRPRKLDARTGSSLPPDAKNAVARKKALVRSWPKN